jgi:hypothetical protein
MQVTPDDAAPRKRVAGVERRRSVAAASAAVERRQASALRFSARRIPLGAAVAYASVGVSPPSFFFAFFFLAEA